MPEINEREIISKALTENISYNHARMPLADPTGFVYHSHDRYELIFLIKGVIVHSVECEIQVLTNVKPCAILTL